MIYTNGPKTSSYHRELKQFAFPRKRGNAGIRYPSRDAFASGLQARSCSRKIDLTSLYPIPIYCEGPLLPS